MFIAALFAIAKTWKQIKCLSTDEWIKMCTCIQWNIAVIKKSEMLPFAATWMELEIIKLNDVNQTKTNTM